MSRENGFLILVNAVALGILVMLGNALVNCVNHIPMPYGR